MLAVRCAAANRTVIDAVVASLWGLDYAIATDRWQPAGSRAAASGNAILAAKIAGFAILTLRDAVTAACIPGAAGVAVAIASDVHAVVALLAASGVFYRIATVGILLAFQAATAALGRAVARTVVALFARLNPAVTASWRKRAARSAGARVAGAPDDRDILAIVAGLGSVHDVIAAEGPIRAVRIAAIVRALVVRRSEIAVFAHSDDAIATSGHTICLCEAAARNTGGRRTRANISALDLALRTPVAVGGVTVIATLIACQNPVPAQGNTGLTCNPALPSRFNSAVTGAAVVINSVSVIALFGFFENAVPTA
jgi:hypothetical protein